MGNLAFEDEGFDGQFQRTLAKAPWFDADIGECFAIASRIVDGDEESWYQEWNAAAKRLRSEAETALAEGHATSARERFLRAGEYHRGSCFWHRDDIDGERPVTAFREQRECFVAAMPHLTESVEVCDVPFDGSFLGGYFVRPTDTSPNEERRTLVVPGGYDSATEEVWSAAVAAAARGWNCYMFDGPGQGNTFFERKIVMRPDWENVLTPVVDSLVARPDVAVDRLALMGRSFGGYLAPRAASREHRFAAVVADPGQHDIGRAVAERMPPDLLDRLDDDSTDAEQAWQSLLEAPAMRRFFAPRMATHGTPTVRGYVRAMREYRLGDLAADVQCPTLVCDNEVDVVSSQQGEELFDLLQCPKEYLQFTTAEGAGGHCEGLGTNLFYERAFDWLDSVVSG